MNRTFRQSPKPLKWLSVGVLQSHQGKQVIEQRIRHGDGILVSSVSSDRFPVSGYVYSLLGPLQNSTFRSTEFRVWFLCMVCLVCLAELGSLVVVPARVK